MGEAGSEISRFERFFAGQRISLTPLGMYLGRQSNLNGIDEWANGASFRWPVRQSVLNGIENRAKALTSFQRWRWPLTSGPKIVGPVFNGVG